MKLKPEHLFEAGTTPQEVKEQMIEVSFWQKILVLLAAGVFIVGCIYLGVDLSKVGEGIKWVAALIGL